MSRKKQQRKIDTGGLNLGLPADEPAIDVLAPVGSSPAPIIAEVAVRMVTADGLSLGKLPDISTIVPQQNVLVEDGLPLFTALQQSPYLHMAARPTELADYVVVSNGLRFWTATRAGLEPAFIEGIVYNDETERIKLVWRPVQGSESGLRVA